jgi:hypothetical protein
VSTGTLPPIADAVAFVLDYPSLGRYDVTAYMTRRDERLESVDFDGLMLAPVDWEDRVLIHVARALWYAPQEYSTPPYLVSLMLGLDDDRFARVMAAFVLAHAPAPESADPQHPMAEES